MGTIKKLIDNNLIGGSSNIEVYPVTSTKAVYDENNKRLDQILKENTQETTNIKEDIKNLSESKTTRTFISDIIFDGYTITIPANAAIFTEKYNYNPSENKSVTIPSNSTITNFIYFDFINKTLLAYEYHLNEGNTEGLGFICAYHPISKEVRGINAVKYKVNGMTVLPNSQFDKTIFSLKRAFIAGVLNIDTINKKIIIPSGFKLAIGSEGYYNDNPLSADVTIDTSTFTYSFMLVYDRSTRTFYAKNFEFVDGSTRTYWLVAIINNSGHWVSYINASSFILNGETHYTNISEKMIKDIIVENTGMAQIIGDISGVGTMGASLMYNGNNWVEDACKMIKTTAYNKAESGLGSPPYFAKKLWNEDYCSDEEFENIDILAIQFASSGDVFTIPDEFVDKSVEEYEAGIDPDAVDTNPFDVYTHAECLDYILKKWQQKCYNQRNNSNSKWYNTQYGKPCRLIFVTHWHDGRIEYNESIRKVAEKWGGGICEFDKKIGFSRNRTLPDGRQVSIIYAVETELINGVEYGWHPLRDLEGEYIQGKMANIFARSLLDYFQQNY